MPTTKPRYTVTDTGDIAAMLDAASRRWPEVTERKELLLRLLAAGRKSRRSGDSRRGRGAAAAPTTRALGRGPGLVDRAVLLGDHAWR